MMDSISERECAASSILFILPTLRIELIVPQS
jgi:hypothetical protein